MLTLSIRNDTGASHNADLKCLAEEIGRSQIIDFRSLCNIFDSHISDVLETYHSMVRIDKSVILEEIEAVCPKINLSADDKE